jgi:heptosyltransferase I
MVAQIRRQAGRPPVDATGDSVRRLMTRIAGSSLVIAPDTGPLHLAHAMGVPVIGLFGHTNPWRVGPYRRFRDLVIDRYTDPGAPPDPADYLPKSGRMETITVRDVLEKVEVARWRYL